LSHTKLLNNFNVVISELFDANVPVIVLIKVVHDFIGKLGGSLFLDIQLIDHEGVKLISCDHPITIEINFTKYESKFGLLCFIYMLLPLKLSLTFKILLS
jgi:hypothetical protein